MTIDFEKKCQKIKVSKNKIPEENSTLNFNFSTNKNFNPIKMGNTIIVKTKILNANFRVLFIKKAPFT